jgi:lysophospholipase L1-like esterase
MKDTLSKPLNNLYLTMKLYVKLSTLVFLIFMFSNCKNNSAVSSVSMPSLSYLALGDSYTIGESVNVEERWPIQLVERLKAQNLNFNSPNIIAKTGWTTDELMAAIKKENIKQKFDMVSLLIGVNNQYRGRDAEVFKSEFINLLDVAEGFSKYGKKGIFVVSIPDWGVTPFAKSRDKALIAKQIDQFNAIKKEVCSAKGIIFIDITDISRENNEKLIASDGLHPSALMYQKWVDRILPNIPTLYAKR